MNTFTATIASAFSVFALVCFGVASTGCIVDQQQDEDEWSTSDEGSVSSDEEALEAASPTPSRDSLRACMCSCGNGVTYGPVGDGVDCQATCHNFFYNNNIVGCTNPCGGGYPVTIK